jgi:hypothetical protein
MTRIAGVFANLHTAAASEAAEVEAWFWMAVALSCVPWVALGAWLVWR